MLGSVHDADDALQETLLGAWKGRSGFEGRSSLRSWLYTIATNASLRILKGRKGREMPRTTGRGYDPREPLAEPLAESVWIEPYPDELLRYDCPVQFSRRIAGPVPASRTSAVLILRVLDFSAQGDCRDARRPVASVTSARSARATVERELPAHSQQETVRGMGEEPSRELVARFVDAWNRADIPGIVAMLAEDSSFSMPPVPTWFRGRDNIAAFLNKQFDEGRVLSSLWRFEATTASGQAAMVGHRRNPETGLDAPAPRSHSTASSSSAATGVHGPGRAPGHRNPGTDRLVRATRRLSISTSTEKERLKWERS
jgi:RNA polymerase sigma-70 factor (ECF subfamily)